MMICGRSCAQISRITILCHHATSYLNRPTNLDKFSKEAKHGELTYCPKSAKHILCHAIFHYRRLYHEPEEKRAKFGTMGAASQREYNSSREIDWPSFRRITVLGCFMRELGEVDRQDPALCLSRWDGEVRIFTGRDMQNMRRNAQEACVMQS